MVSPEFGRPTRDGTHPKHAVALGAALLADVHRSPRAADASSGEQTSPHADGALGLGTGTAGARVLAVAAARSAGSPPTADSAAAPSSSDVAAESAAPGSAGVPVSAIADR